MNRSKMVILDRFKEPHLLEQVCCGVLKETYASLQVDVEHEKIAYIANYIGVEFMGKSFLRKMPAIDIAPEFRKQIPPHYVSWYGKKKDFIKEHLPALNISISDLKKRSH